MLLCKPVNSTERAHEPTPTGFEPFTVKYMPRPRFCGARVVEVSSPWTASQLKRNGAVEYVGPVLDHISYDVTDESQVDWQEAMEWIWARMGEEEKQMFLAKYTPEPKSAPEPVKEEPKKSPGRPRRRAE